MDKSQHFPLCEGSIGKTPLICQGKTHSQNPECGYDLDGVKQMNLVPPSMKKLLQDTPAAHNRFSGRPMENAHRGVNVHP